MVGSFYWTPERVRALRKRAGLTQEAMAHLLCVAPRTLVRWEGGKRAPTGLYVKVLDNFRDHWDRVREFRDAARCFVSFVPRLADQHRHGCEVPWTEAHDCRHYRELDGYCALCMAQFRISEACKDCVAIAETMEAARERPPLQAPTDW
jgi:hypothetical protein